jgi:sortase A
MAFRVSGPDAAGPGERARPSAASEPTREIDVRGGTAPSTSPAQVAVLDRPAPVDAALHPPPRPVAPAKRGLDVPVLAGQVLLVLSALALGFLLFVGVLSALPQKRAQSGLQRAFAISLANRRAAIGGPIPAGTPVARLDIVRIGLHQVVVEGTSADQLRKGPGHVPVSPMPGQPGNVVMAAHRMAWGGPFSGLDRLRPDDAIVLLTGQGSFTYDVVSRNTVSSKDTAPFAATTDNRLTLITADNLMASRRLVVVAALVGNPQAAPPGRAPVLTARDGGLVGQHGVLPALGLWLEVLLLTAVGTVLLYRRLPLWSSYLMTTPVVLAVVWLVYSNLARLLPASL